MRDDANPTESDERLASLLDEYMEALERGERPDRESFIAQHPQVAESLRNALLSLEFVASAAGGAARSPAVDRSPIEKPMPDRLLGDYLIIREIGRGGMAIVYEAEQVSLGRRVALKVLPFISVLGSRQLARFKNEAQAAALLTHQNIVPVYSVGCERGMHFFAMQYIDGQSLAELIEQIRRTKRFPKSPNGMTGTHPNSAKSSDANQVDQLDTSEAVAIATEPSTGKSEYWGTVAKMVIQACHALEHAHAVGVLHRDVKPANLLLDATGNLWITDFGLARIENEMEITMSGDVIGTLRYMSPEQALGRQTQIDERSDIYSLGVTLFELLTLRPAIEGKTREEVLRKITSDDPPTPRRFEPAVPRELDTICRKAMAKHPPDRYPTARQFADDLQRFLDDKPILAKPPNAVQRVRKWTRRHRVFVGTACIGLFATLVVAISILAYSNYQIELQRRRAVGLEKERREELIESLVQKSSAIRQGNAAGRRERALQAVTHAHELSSSLSDSPDLQKRIRDETVACLVTNDLKQEQSLQIDFQNWIHFDRELEQFAAIDRQGNINVRRVSDGHLLIQLATGDADIRSTLFSPDRKLLAAFDQRHRITVWDLKKGTVLFESPCFRTACFSPDRRTLAIGQQDGSIDLVDLESWQRRRLSPGVVPQSMQFHPDGTKLAVCGFASTILQIRDCQTGAVTRELVDHLSYLGDVCWSNDGNRIAVGCLDGRIYIRDMIRKKIAAVLKHPRQVIRVRFNWDGSLLASTGHDGNTRLWQTHTGQLLSIAVGHFREFHRDKNLLSFQTKQSVGIWTATNDAILKVRTSRWDPNGAQALCVDPLGELLMTIGPYGLAVWDLASGTEVNALPLDECGGALFDADGTSLYTASESGLLKWPIVRTEASNQVQLGPPKLVTELYDTRPLISLSKNNRYMAFRSSWDSACVVDLSAASDAVHLRGHPNVYRVVISPDARWVATSAYPGLDLMVWDARTGENVATFPGGFDNIPVFSHDGRYLAAVAVGEYRNYRVGTWKQLWTIPTEQQRGGAVAFAPDNSTLAIYQAPGDIRLVQADKGIEIARLESPEMNSVGDLHFSPDGRYLTLASSDRLHLWDLQQLSHELSQLGLTWLPSLTQKMQVVGTPRRPVQVTIDRGNVDFRDRRSDSRFKRIIADIGRWLRDAVRQLIPLG